MKVLTLDREAVKFNIGGKDFFIYYTAMGDARMRYWEIRKIQMKGYKMSINVFEKFKEWNAKLSSGNDILGAIHSVRDDITAYTQVIRENGGKIENVVDAYYDTIWQMLSMILVTKGEVMKEVNERIVHDKIEHWKKSGVTTEDAFFFVKRWLKLSQQRSS